MRRMCVGQMLIYVKKQRKHQRLLPSTSGPIRTNTNYTYLYVSTSIRQLQHNIVFDLYAKIYSDLRRPCECVRVYEFVVLSLNYLFIIVYDIQQHAVASCATHANDEWAHFQCFTIIFC